MRVIRGVYLAGQEAQGPAPGVGSVDLAAVLGAWPESARVLSLSGEIIHVTPAGVALAELPLERLRGHAWPQLCPPESRGPMTSLRTWRLAMTSE